MKLGSLVSLVTVTIIQLVQHAATSTKIRCPEFYAGLHMEEDIHNKFLSAFASGKEVSFDKT